MSTTRERSSSRHVSGRGGRGGRGAARKDATHGFPIQVSLPDGETAFHQYNPCLRHNGGQEQEAEMIRAYLKPPENKSISDMEAISHDLSRSTGILGGTADKERGCYYRTSSSNHPNPCSPTSLHTSNRHPTPLDSHYNYNQYNPMHGNQPTGSSTFSLSSSSSSISSNSALGGSPKGRKTSFQMQLKTTFLPTKEKSSHEGGTKRHSRSRNNRGTTHASTLHNCPAATALADIDVIPCSTAAAPLSPSYYSEEPHSPTPQGLCDHLPPQLPSPGIEQGTPPPMYSEVIGTRSIYGNYNRQNRRTSSGKI